MSSELKPCPFCGSRADLEITSLFEGDTTLVVSCTGCGCELLARRNATEQEAIAAWNQRAKLEPKRIEAPFAIGDIIEPNEPNKYHKRFEVVRDTGCYMELRFLDSGLAGMTMKRRKDVLKRDYRSVVD